MKQFFSTKSTMKLVTFALTLYAIFGYLNAKVSVVNVCEGVKPNVFLPVVGNCSEYINCRDNIPFEGHCEPGTLFDAKTQSCTLPSEAQCLPSCTNTLSSFYYDNTCTKYVLCYLSSPVLQQCCDGLQYNPQTDRCDFPEYVDCVTNLCPLIEDEPGVLYIPSKSACDKYFICMEGETVEQSCTKGLKFNPSCNCCDFASNVNCSISALQRNILPYAKAPPKKADITCPSVGVHFQAHALPDRYYFCMNGKGVILECTPGLVYDPAMETCREAQNIKIAKL